VWLANVPLTGVVSDDEFIFFAPLFPFAGNRAGRFYLLNSIALIEFANKRRIAVREHEEALFTVYFLAELRKCGVFLVPESCAVVAVIGLVVRRVEVVEVARTRADMLEAALVEFHVLQEPRTVA